MTKAEIEQALVAAAELRAPSFANGTRLDAKIARLEDHMLACAYARGDLEQCWITLTDSIVLLEEKFIDFEASGRLKEDRERSRREEDPANWGALRDAQRLRSQVERQISRLIKDEAAVSRAYTFVTGQS